MSEYKYIKKEHEGVKDLDYVIKLEQLNQLKRIGDALEKITK
jgi:hypothetical protein